MPKKKPPATISQTAVGDGNIQITGSYNTVIQRAVPPVQAHSEKKRFWLRLTAGVSLLLSILLLVISAWLPGWFTPALATGFMFLCISISLALSSALFVHSLSYRWLVIRDYERYRRQNIHIELFARVRPDPFVDSAGDAMRLSALARESKKPVVILGEPGSGKTESLRWLAAHFARRSWNKIPVRVELRDIAPSFDDDTSRLIGVSPDWLDPNIQTVLCAALGRYNEMLADHLITLLKAGRLIVMIDALDELRYHSEVPAGLRKLMQAYPKNKYVLTCRRHDYSRYQATLGEDTNLADLCPFSRENILAFLQAQVGSQAGELLKNLDRFYLIDFASNPLTLWMLSILWLERLPGEVLPHNRGTIIQAYVLALLRRNRKKIGTTHLYSWLDDEPFIRILANVAAQLIGQQRLELKLEDVEEALVGSSEIPEPQAVLDQAIDTGLSKQITRSSLAAPATYQFIHRQVLEYLGAEWLLLQWLVGASAFHIYLEHAWWEPHVLQAGLLDQASREKLVLFILSQLSDRRAIFLAIACAGVETGLSEACLSKIRSALKDVAQAGLLPEDEETLIQLGKVGGPPAVEIVADLLDLPDQTIRLGCVRILGKIGADSGAIPLIERALQDRDLQVARTAATELKHVCTNVSHAVIDRLVEGFGWLQNWELAVEVASEVKTVALEESLVVHLGDSRSLVAAGCAWVIGHSGQPEESSFLSSLASHPNRLIQLTALHGLCLLGKRKYNRQRRRLLNRLDLELYIPAEIDRYLQVFKECLIPSDRSTLLAAAKALCNTQDWRVVPILDPFLERLDNRTLEAVIRYAGSVASQEAQAMLARLSQWQDENIAHSATSELEKVNKPRSPSRVSSYNPRRGIVSTARPDQPDYYVKDMEKVRIPDTVKDPEFLLDYISSKYSHEDHITGAVLGLALLGQPSQIQAAYECLSSRQAKGKLSEQFKYLKAVLEHLKGDSDNSPDSRFQFAHLLAACSQVYFDGWGEEIALGSKQNCVVAGALYAKRYGLEQFISDLSVLLNKQDEPAQVKAFAAFALAALGGRNATAAICSGFQAIGQRLRKVPDAIIGIKWARNNTLAIRACAEALEGLQDPTAVPALLESIWRNESSGDTLLAILEALQMIGDPSAIPALARVARYETSTWGNPDEVGGSVSEVAGECVRRLRRGVVQSYGENARVVYEKLLHSETQLEQRYEQLRHPTTGSWLPRRLTAFSMSTATPRRRYFLAKCISPRCDPRQSLWQWLRWEIMSRVQFINNFWFMFMTVGMAFVLLILLGVILPIRLWWWVFVQWIGGQLIGRIAGSKVGQFLGGATGTLITSIAIYAILRLRRKKAAMQSLDTPVSRDIWGLRREATAIYDWILEHLGEAGITLECTL